MTDLMTSRGAVSPERQPPTRSLRLPSAALVAVVVVMTLELVRALFSVGYHFAEGVGWVPGGLIVVATFAVPVLAPWWRRAAGRAALPVAVGILVADRLVAQAVRPVPYWLAAVGVAAAMLVLAELLSATRPVELAAGLLVGLAADTVVRAFGTTWDILWRSDAWAWAVAAALAAAAVVLVRRRPADPPDVFTPGRAAAVLLGPFLYLACFYTQSPAFLASSGHLPVAAAVAIAVADAALAAGALMLGAGWEVPGWAAGARDLLARGTVVAVVLLAAAGWFLPAATGAAAVALAVAAQLLAAALFGVALGEPAAEPFGRLAWALAGGMVAFGLLGLAYQVSFLVSLPFPRRLMPALAGLIFLVVPRVAPAVRGRRAPELRPLVPALGALALVVPTVLAVTAPATAAATAPSGAVTVMTFNINEAVRSGQLDLAEIARLVRAEQPDVVVLEEVGRGMAVSGMTDEAEWLHRELRLPYVWAPAGDNQYGNLVLTRLPVLDHSVMALGKGDGTQDRSAAFVRLGAGRGTDLLVIGTHLQNGSAPALHRTRADEYRAVLGRWAGAPRTILLGDLNTYPGWAELRLVTGAGFRTTQNTRSCTMPTSNENCPDWVFASPDLHLSGVHVTVTRPDHSPVVGTVTITPAE